jgi:acyl transferase domain-containing protein
MAGEADTVAALAGIPEIQAANFNAPAQTVISGSRAGLERAGARLKAAGLRMREIPVAGAFHSSFMEPARATISRRLAETPFRPPALPVYSNTLADRYPADTGAWPALLGEHLVKPVRFVQEVENIYGDGGRIFVESGPGNVLTNLVGRILAGREFVAFAPGSPAGAGGLSGLLDCLAGLFVEGVVPGRLPADLYGPDAGGPEASTPRPVTRA